MPKYHIGCSLDGKIYVGTQNKTNKSTWVNMTDVTESAILAVINCMDLHVPKDKDWFAYCVKRDDGCYATLKLERSWEKPDWIDDPDWYEVNMNDSRREN